MEDKKFEERKNRILRLDGYYPRPEPLILRDEVPVLFRRQLTLISGPKKTFKTHLHQIFLSNACGISKVFRPAQEDMKLRVLTIDTEQGPDLLQDQYKFLLREAGRPTDVVPENIRTIWELCRAPRQIIEDLEAEATTFHPDIIIIDGVADLVDDFNDLHSSSDLVRRLQHLAFDLNAAVVTVIHQNPRDKKERGHLGTILGNKTTGYICLSRERGCVKVSCADGARLEPFADFFVRFDTGTKTLVETDPLAVTVANQCRTVTNAIEGRRLSANDKMAKSILAFFECDLYGNYKTMRASDIEQLLMKQFGIQEKNRTKATRALKTAVQLGLIKKVGHGIYLPKDDMK